MILLKQMVVLFLIMLLGFGLAKKGILDTVTGKKMSWLVVNVCNPALILSGSLGEEVISVSSLQEVLAAAVVMYLLLLVLGLILPGLIRADAKERSAYRIMTVFTNIGFMGFPLISSMYGSGALLYGTVFSIPYNLLIYTYGICAIRGGSFSIKQLKQVLNTGVAACAAAIGIYVLKLFVPVRVPEIITQTVDLLSGMTAPLSMMVIGASLAGLSLKELVKDKKMLLFAGLRLILIPCLFMSGFRHFLADPVLLGVCLIMLATPAGSMTVMLSQQYDGNVETTSKGVALTTILSVATLPLLFMIMGL